MSPPESPELRLDPADVRIAPPRSPRLLPIVAGGLLGLAAVYGWVWWSQQPPQLVARRAPPPQVQPDARPAAPADTASQFPPPVADGAPPLQERDIPAALAQLLGRRGLVGFVQADDFPRRFVATLDNLARAHAPPSVWPVMPMPGRFTVADGPDGSQVIAPSNAQRYAPFVSFVASVDSAAAVQLYARMYPVLQQAYRQLGNGDPHLNYRLVKVIDHLLATPEPQGPVQVHLTEVKGPIESTRPWVRYEYVDDELENLSAGQKMLLRVGPANERKLKQKLAELRRELVGTQPQAQTQAAVR
jgi:hypothetical protein